MSDLSIVNPEKIFGSSLEEEEVPPSGWPEPMSSAALHGPAGNFVRLIRNSTEADEHAVLLAFLTLAGNMMGRDSFFVAEDTRHYPNLFTAIVGDSAKARKGTAVDRVTSFFRRVDPSFMERNTGSGLSTGEGLIHAIRDPRRDMVEIKEGRGGQCRREEQLVDVGVNDKRFFIEESEFAVALKNAGRDGNNLSATLRKAWDSKPLRVTTKSNKDMVSAPHVSIVASITVSELQILLTSNDRFNGFANRFLFVAARKSKNLPHGGRPIEDRLLKELADRVLTAIEAAKSMGEIGWDQAAYDAWIPLYNELSKVDGGPLMDVLTARAHPQVRRLAMIYALLDQSRVVTLAHLTAANEVWTYCEDSVRFIFGTAAGDKIGVKILNLLKGDQDGMSQKEINDALGGHVLSEEINRSLDFLMQQGLAASKQERGKGRPKTVWFFKPANKAD